MSETRQDEVARCTECWQRADTVELLPDARLDAKGVCGYCRRVGIQSPTPPLAHGPDPLGDRINALLAAGALPVAVRDVLIDARIAQVKAKAAIVAHEAFLRGAGISVTVCGGNGEPLSPASAEEIGRFCAKLAAQRYAAPPQERVSEAVPMPTDDEAWALYREIRRMFPDEQEAIGRFARALTAALSAGGTNV